MSYLICISAILLTFVSGKNMHWPFSEMYLLSHNVPFFFQYISSSAEDNPYIHGSKYPFLNIDLSCFSKFPLGWCQRYGVTVSVCLLFLLCHHLA